MPTLNFDTYGKTRVRLLQVMRSGEVHEVVEINVNIFFEGEFADSYITGDNSKVLPTDTMKNTVYALARKCPIQSIEEFGSRLAKHFMERLEQVHKVTVSIDQTPWDRIANYDAAFVQSRKEQRTAKLTVTRGSHLIIAGIRNIQILKTSRSSFFGYLKDEYTTLPETRDRLLGTVLDADWSISGSEPGRDFNQLHQEIRRILLGCFATHESLSVQQTLYAMGQAVLATVDSVQDIHLIMPNKHCLLVDLSRFGLDNPNQIFVPTDEPAGYIEARLSR